MKIQKVFFILSALIYSTQSFANDVYDENNPSYANVLPNQFETLVDKVTYHPLVDIDDSLHDAFLECPNDTLAFVHYEYSSSYKTNCFTLENDRIELLETIEPFDDSVTEENSIVHVSIVGPEDFIHAHQGVLDSFNELFNGSLQRSRRWASDDYDYDDYDYVDPVWIELAKFSAELALDLTPVVSDLKAVYEVTMGKDIYGNELTDAEIALAVMAIALPPSAAVLNKHKAVFKQIAFKRGPDVKGIINTIKKRQAKNLRKIRKYVAKIRKTRLCRASGFADDAKFTKHFNKHAIDFGDDISEGRYKRMAKRFLSGRKGRGIKQFKKRDDGDFVRFNPNNGYFGVVSEDGVIKSFYRAGVKRKNGRVHKKWTKKKGR